MPAGAPKAKQIQALQYGAEVELVDGTYDEAFELALEYRDKPDFISRNTAFNPLTIEGKKTAALEIFSSSEGSRTWCMSQPGRSHHFRGSQGL